MILYLDQHGGRKHGNDSSHLQTSDHFMHERHGQQDRKHGLQAACHYRACWIQIFSIREVKTERHRKRNAH